ncbi:MAG: response regulator [Proteobacteria bacterium]|nr:response regulator [Pseudomonadota bacterium]
MFKLLLIENSRAVRGRINEALKNSGLKLSLIEVSDCPAAIDLFPSDSFDCLLLGACPKQKTSQSALKKLTGDKSWPDLPVILLINHKDQAGALELLGGEARDYLVKDEISLPRLAKAITNVIMFHRMEAKLQLAETELEKLRQQSETSGDNKAIRQLTGDFGHDFNNMLTSILASLRMASQEIMPEPVRKHVEQAVEIVMRGADLTQDLLTFSQQTNPKGRVIEPNEIAKGLKARVREHLGQAIDFQVRLSLKRLRIFVDPIAFEDILVNLIINACEAIRGFGKVTVDISQCSVDGTRAGEKTFKSGQYVLVEVRDSGIGMSEAVLKKAIDPMFSTNKNSDGADSGLSNVREFVKQSDGYLEIESERNKGTNIKLFLPLSRRMEERETYGVAEKGPLEFAGSGQTILLVEDDINVLKVVGHALKAKNYNVLKAGDAEEAFKILLAEKKIDLLVTDVFLPNDFTGKDIAKKIHLRFPEAGIIYCSGYHEDEVRKKIALGPEGEVISKPYEISTLLIKMANLLKGAGHEK